MSAGDAMWTAVGTLEGIPDGRGVKVDLEGAPVLVVRWGETVVAIGARCTHQGAPLDRGPLRLSESLRTVTCPAHGSVFRLDDGAVMRGPARNPVAGYEVRVEEGQVSVRPRG